MWILPSDERPSAVYTTKSEVDHMVTLTWGVFVNKVVYLAGGGSINNGASLTSLYFNPFNIHVNIYIYYIEPIRSKVTTCKQEKTNEWLPVMEMEDPTNAQCMIILVSFPCIQEEIITSSISCSSSWVIYRTYCKHPVKTRGLSLFAALKA